MTRAAGTFRDVGTSLYQVFKEFQSLPFSIHWNYYKICLYWKKYEFCPHQGFKHSGGPECITRSKFEFQSFKGMTLTTDQKQALNRYFISLSNWFFPMMNIGQIFRKRKCFKNQSTYFKTSLTDFISYIQMWKLISEFFFLKIRILPSFRQLIWKFV